MTYDGKIEPVPFTVRFYASAADCLAAYCTGNQHETFASLEAAGFHFDAACVGLEGDAQHDEKYLRDVIAQTVERRAWGFSSGSDVHVWIGPDATPDDIAQLLGHELGHVLRSDAAEERTKGLEHDDDALTAVTEEEERIADSYGAVALTVMQFLAARRVSAPASGGEK